MPRIVLSLAEWHAVARELAAGHTAVAPPGVLERIRALLEQAPQGWPEQPFALELDESSAEAIHAAHASLTSTDPHGGQRDASVAEAMRIIYDHQQHD
jgi:hypothetical protein